MVSLLSIQCYRGRSRKTKLVMGATVEQVKGLESWLCDDAMCHMFIHMPDFGHT